MPRVAIIPPTAADPIEAGSYAIQCPKCNAICVYTPDLTSTGATWWETFILQEGTDVLNCPVCHQNSYVDPNNSESENPWHTPIIRILTTE